jgi:hypothetical protein
MQTQLMLTMMENEIKKAFSSKKEGGPVNLMLRSYKSTYALVLIIKRSHLPISTGAFKARVSSYWLLLLLEIMDGALPPWLIKNLNTKYAYFESFYALKMLRALLCLLGHVCNLFL